MRKEEHFRAEAADPAAGIRRSTRNALFALLAIGLGLGIGFALGTVLERPLAQLDRALLLALRVPDDPDRPIGPAWLAIAVRDLTALGGHTLIVTIAVVTAAYLAIADRWPRALLIVATAGGAILLSFLLKAGIGRPRPDLVAHLVDVRTLSFPSGHAFLAAVVYPTIGALVAGAQAARALRLFVLAVAILVTATVGLTRIYLGVHWPTDVIAGWLIGGAWAAACWHIAHAIGAYRRRSALTGMHPPGTASASNTERAP